MANYISRIQYGNTEYRIKAASLQTIDESENPIAAGKIPSADGEGGLNWNNPSSGVQSVGGLSGIISVGAGLSADNSNNSLKCIGMDYEINPPSADFTAGGYRVAILDAEPEDLRTGWLYYILENN